MDLFTDTQKLVLESKETFAQISQSTGLGERWLRKYAKGEFQDVGVKRLQKLRNYLLDQLKAA